MDEITSAVRALYERFPYPSGPPTVRVGFDARHLTSLARLARPAGRGLRVLDAGCGRGVGLLAAASLQPAVAFVGADMNRVALAEARAEVRRRGLANVELVEADLTTLSGLQVPDGGFDVIVSSGVVHHMPDPARALELLGGALAPHGVLSLMVYAARGREGLHRVARAVSTLAPRERPLDERLRLGRALAAERARTGDDADWAAAAAADDVEFVDRYLHVQEASYDVESLLALVADAGLRPLRWADPEAWELPAFDDAALAARAAALDERARWRLAEELRAPLAFELYICRPENGPRAALRADELERAALAVHPEVLLEVATRNLWGHTRVEAVRWRRAGGPAAELTGAQALAAGLLKEQSGPFRGAALVGALGEQGVERGAARAAALELLRRGVLYAPHEVELPALQPA